MAASVMSDLIHKDPTCFAALDAAGLPATFLDAITSGVLPSSEAVGCIPNSLDALCLNNSGLQAVRDRNALGCFVKIFTSKAYVRALANDTPGSLASGLDELMRHAPTLRGPGIDMCIEILKTIAAIGGATVEPSVAVTVPEPAISDVAVPMDTDAEERPSGVALGDTAKSQPILESGADSNSSNVECTFIPECINNAVRLLETVLQNADTSRVFIEKKGIEALLQLYTLPHLPVSFGGSSTAHNMSVTFRAFSPQHSAALTRAVCGGLRDHLQVNTVIKQLPFYVRCFMESMLCCCAFLTSPHFPVLICACPCISVYPIEFAGVFLFGVEFSQPSSLYISRFLLTLQFPLDSQKIVVGRLPWSS